MALDGGVLYALVGPADPLDQTARWKSTNHGWPWDRISQGYNNDEYRWGYAKTLLAIDPKSKKVLWQPPGRPADRQPFAGDEVRPDLLRFLRPLPGLPGGRQRAAGLEADGPTGPGPFPLHRPLPSGPWLHRAAGRARCIMKCTDRALYFVGPQVQWLTAVSTFRRPHALEASGQGLADRHSRRRRCTPWARRTAATRPGSSTR